MTQVSSGKLRSKRSQGSSSGSEAQQSLRFGKSDDVLHIKAGTSTYAIPDPHPGMISGNVIGSSYEMGQFDHGVSGPDGRLLTTVEKS